ncbi:aldehyde dehydrogenase domain-containing protein [Stachybotrys elegans]|uniref:Aldehyde dehydrogenase domain-containing protein n=1 Tax=Stachybotrys elegans TaxID=80388 RepID=A0A8K0SU58_9HYPO|nr:aldehyde dehydrogenase domain-containing protein [Stachybotrys elegans]
MPKPNPQRPPQKRTLKPPSTPVGIDDPSSRTLKGEVVFAIPESVAEPALDLISLGIVRMAAQTNGSGSPVPLFIGGQDYTPSSALDVISPITGKVIHRCGAASVEDAGLAVQAAADALAEWRKTTPKTRRDIFMKAADIMDKRKDELVGYMHNETGGSEAWCGFNLMVAADFIRDVAGRISTLAGSFPQTQDPNVGAIVMQEPYGVVLAIAPWNAPYILGTRAVAFPMAAGNTVVFKATEMSPKTMLAIASVFDEAGLPKGVLNVVVADPASAGPVTEALIANPHVKKINFTGSTAVGRIIGKVAGQNLKPCVLELGGKAPAIVWEDADLNVAAKECALGAFLNAGQICMSTERILVHKSVKEAFTKALSASVEAIFCAPEAEAPLLIRSDAVEKNRKLVADAVSKGASVIFGDKDAQESSPNRMRPIVLGDVTPEMDIYRNESFGPTVSVIEIETEEEAIRIANDTEYGLTSAVFTEDLRRGLRFAREIESGAVHINSMTVHDESILPHGGAKASGYGRFNTTNGLGEWVRSKAITFKL